jgi:hypothetical protein
MVLAALGGMFVLYGGMFLLGMRNAILKPDLARIMGIKVTPGLLKFTIFVSAFLIVIGFAMLSSNLLAMSAVLQ